MLLIRSAAALAFFWSSAFDGAVARAAEVEGKVPFEV